MSAPVLHPEEPLIFDITQKEFALFHSNELVCPYFIIKADNRGTNDPYYMALCRETATDYLERMTRPKHRFFVNEPILPVILSQSYYNIPPGTGWNQISLNIVRFIDFVERTINLAERTKVHRTDYEEIIQIHPSSFWLSNYTFTSLFTLVVRAGGFYNENTSLDEMMNRDYFQNTKDAFKKFLDGHIHYSINQDPGWGWFRVFAYPNNLYLLRKKEEVGEKAKEFWESAGCPSGRDEEFWLESCQHFDEESRLRGIV